MTESLVRIDALGRIRIPKDFRKLFGMEIGDTVNLAVLSDCIVVQKIPNLGRKVIWISMFV